MVGAGGRAARGCGAPALARAPARHHSPTSAPMEAQAFAPPGEYAPQDGGYPPDDAFAPPAMGGPGATATVLLVARARVGRVIGRAGETIKALQCYTGATIQIDQSSDPTRVVLAGPDGAVRLAAAMTGVSWGPDARRVGVACDQQACGVGNGGAPAPGAPAGRAPPPCVGSPARLGAVGAGAWPAALAAHLATHAGCNGGAAPSLGAPSRRAAAGSASAARRARSLGPPPARPLRSADAGASRAGAEWRSGRWRGRGGPCIGKARAVR